MNREAKPDALRRVALLAGAVAGAWAASGCGVLVDRPGRPNLYDLGPTPALPSAREPGAPPLVLAEVEAAGVLEGSGIVYRLDYLDPHQLRAYGQSRWSQPLPQLVRQRLADRLAGVRVVLGPADAATLSRAGAVSRVLRIELLEFAQHFPTAGRDESQGRLRLRATLQQPGAGPLAQRVFVATRMAPSGDAAGGVRALAACLDEVAGQLDAWLQEAGAPQAPRR